MTDVVDWTAAAGRVTWVPARYRDPSMSAAAARRSLRCDERSFARLVDLGLPGTDGPDGPMYDPCDVRNAGLWSGTGATDAEVAMRYVLGFTHAGRDELTRARRWSYAMRLLPGGDGEPARVYRPAPEDSGGEVTSWDPPEAYEGDFFRFAPGTEVTGTLTTRGDPDTVVSPVVRRAMDDVLDSGVRWQLVPRALELRPLEAYALGFAGTAVLCAVLAHRLREAGVAATARKGWLVAPSRVVHAVVEVVDDDARRKVLDPSLALLASSGFGPPELRELVTGSTVNRVVLSRCPLLEPFVAGEPYDAADRAVFACRTAGR